MAHAQFPKLIQRTEYLWPFWDLIMIVGVTVASFVGAGGIDMVKYSCIYNLE